MAVNNKKKVPQTLKQKRADAELRRTEREKTKNKRLANAGKTGYDRYGTKLRSTRRAEDETKKQNENLEKVVSTRKKRDEEIRTTLKREKSEKEGKKQANRIKETISKPGVKVDQSELIRKRSREANKGGSSSEDLGNYRKNRKTTSLKDKINRPNTIERLKANNTDTDSSDLKDYQKKKHVKSTTKKKPSNDERFKNAPTADGLGSSKTSRSQKRADKRKGRLKAKARKLSDKGYEYGADDKKGKRLLKRASRKRQRAAGTRKSAVGTAVTKVGRGLHSAGHAYATFEKKKYDTKAHEKKKKK